MANVTNEAEFKDAVSGSDAEIIVDNDISLTSQTNIGRAVTVKSESGAALLWAGLSGASANMLTVTESGDLTVEALTLDGMENDVTLVRVSGGRFTMNAGAVLRNIRSTTSQDAVQVGDNTTALGGHFAMNGGLITGVSSDDAVFCGGATMTMSGDAAISGNAATGVVIVDTAYTLIRSTLTMTGNARISDNTSPYTGGGGLIMGSDLIMGVNEGDAPVITGNSCSTYGGGLYLTKEVDSTNLASLTMRYNAEISDNSAPRYGGGFIANGATIDIGGDAAILNNNTNGDADGHGGGIMLYSNSTATLGGSARVSGNTAVGSGGGIYISSATELNLTGNASISGNTAAEGSGVYNAGVLRLSQSPQIADGLFFIDAQTVPVIADTLTADASIQLAASAHVAPSNVPLAIADKGEDYASLVESDRAAWLIPPSFGDGYTVTLNPELTQVLISFTSYGITYRKLNGVRHSNPTAYTVADLPIALADPETRPGYAFKGWYDTAGRRVSEIAAGTTGDLVLTAVWEKLTLSFEGNADGVWNLPQNMPVRQGEIAIPNTIPRRACHCFFCWNMPDSGSGRAYFPGDTIVISDGAVTLYAQWQPL